MTCKRLETWDLIGTRTSETCEKFWSLALRNYQKKIAIVKSHKGTLTIGLRGSYNNSALSIHKLKFFYQILSFRFIYKWIITFQTWSFSDKISCGIDFRQELDVSVHGKWYQGTSNSLDLSAHSSSISPKDVSWDESLEKREISPSNIFPKNQIFI